MRLFFCLMSLTGFVFIDASASDSADRLAELETALRKFDMTSLKDLEAMPRYRSAGRRLINTVLSNENRIKRLRKSLSKLNAAVRRAKNAPPLHPRRKVSERIGYYYIDDPNRSFVPITIPRDPHRNVKWIYPPWSESNPSLKKAEKALKEAADEIGDLISENDESRREYKNLRRRCESAIKAEIKRLTSSAPATPGGDSRNNPAVGSREKESVPPPTTPLPSTKVGVSDPKLNIEGKLKKKLIGKTKAEVLKICGRPTSPMTIGEVTVWSYKKHHKDPVTGQLADMGVVFRNGKVTMLSFFAVPDLKPLPKQEFK